MTMRGQGTSRCWWLAAAFGICAAWQIARGAVTDASWWEAETRMNTGFLSFRDKPWWSKAQGMVSGERIYLDLNKDGRRDTIIFKEGTTIVEVLDDGLHWSNNTTMGDYQDSCWVVDYDGDGLVDRIIDYVDNDNNGFPDEAEVRFFQAGNLVWEFIYETFDKRWPAWAGWHYNWYEIKRKVGDIPGGDFAEVFALIGSGDSSYTINKYDKDRNRFIPFSECPFAFFNLDNDERSEAVIRVSAAPLSTAREAGSTGVVDLTIHEFANSYANIWGPFRPEMLKMGNLNVRYSYNIKNDDTERKTLGYDMGFTLVGKAPYEYPDMNGTNPKRREPKTVVRVAHHRGLEMADHYPADETGFSWDEWGDSALSDGARPIYEGVFWIYERHILYNTGGPSRKWHMRREYNGSPTTERKLYYSEVDRRIHLVGATDGWTETGHVFGSEKLAESRMFDTDGDGYFDRWEWDLDNDGLPDRVSSVRDPRARPLPFVYKDLSAFYTKDVLPSAIEANQTLINEFKRYVKLDGEPAKGLEEKAQATNLPERKRYLLDLVREYYYQAFRKKGFEISNRYGIAVRSRNGQESTRTQGFESEQWWKFTRDLSQIDQSYGSGHYDQVIRALRQHESILQ